ncbi:MAG: DUF748 domain-containing protein [Proteobacteria bacterium]|nr:DUF748 domain-containing protein [Pseudomonadota bacterium]
MNAAANAAVPPIRRRRWLRRVAVAGGIVAAVLVAAWLGVPVLARHLLETRLADALHRPVAVTDVRFNPLTLEAEIQGGVIGAAPGAGPDARPLLTFRTLAAQFSLASLWHRAPVVDRLTLTGPQLALTRKADGTYSVQDLVDEWLGGPPGPPARFSLNNIQVQGGTIDFADEPAHREHEVRDLTIGIPFLSSLDYQTKIQVMPRVAATVNGSAFSLTGTTTPFAAERDAALDIDLDNVSLPEYAAYLPFKLRGRLAAGTLTTRAKLIFTDGAAQTRSLWLSGEVKVANAAFVRGDGQKLAAIDAATAHVARLDLVNHHLVIDALTLRSPSLDVRRAADGRVNLAEPLVEPAAPGAPPAPGTAAWQVDVERVRIDGGKLAIADDAVRPAFRANVSALDVEATDLSTRADRPAHVRVRFDSDVGADAIAEFDLLPATLDAKGHFGIRGVALGKLYPYYASALNLVVQRGSADVDADFETSAAVRGRRFLLTGGKADIADAQMALPGERDPLWRIPRLALEGVTLDAGRRTLDVGTLTTTGGTLALRRDADGTFNFGRILKTAAPANAAGASAGDAWQAVVKRTRIAHYTVDVDDRVPTPPVTLHLAGVDATADNLSNDYAKAATVTLRARVGDAGTLALDGAFTPNPVSAQWKVDATRLQLTTLQPYLDPYVNVVVTDGQLGATGTLTFTAGDERSAARVRWNGDVTVTGFNALDRPTLSPLARWKTLKLTGVDVSTEPRTASIGAVALSDFFARVTVYDDASLNFVRLVKADATPGAPSGPSWPLTVGRIELARGEVQYSDFYIKPNYTAHLTDVGGDIGAMSAREAAAVNVTAKLDGSAPVEVSGRVNPLAKDLVLDVTGTARDIELPPLSPYFAKYAGYGVTRGKLGFDVRYKVENRKLAATNRLVLDQLTFGPHVDSPTATKLPVLLATSLLKDARGVIDVELPISGSLDDPRFSVGGLIVQVIVNLLTKAVTSPFALLGAAFGGGEELSWVDFTPGSAALAPPAVAKLDKLGKALGARPALRVEIGGRVDPNADAEALRHAAVEAQLRAVKAKALAAEGAPVTDPAAVVVAPDERVRYLTAVYKDAPIDERPRNFIGMLKDVPPADMEAMLLKHARAGPDDLAALAQRRAQAVKDALIARGVASDRLFIVTTARKDAPKDAAASRVDLALK